jgi:hypothetical protein
VVKFATQLIKLTFFSAKKSNPLFYVIGHCRSMATHFAAKNNLFGNEAKNNFGQGCQMLFQTKNTNLGKFWRALQMKKLVYALAIWKTYIMAIWYI